MDDTALSERLVADGDNAFDVTVGLFGMLELLIGRRKPGD
jgi:hypothetical protein